ncbi:MAG: NAD(P)-dependent alcohol dehydrogenase [Suipraeoptans sp.]
MKTVRMQKYNSPESLQLLDIEKPNPKDNEVLIKVCASTINSYDFKKMKGKPIVMRLQNGIFSPKKNSLGCDVAGIIEKIGKNVTNFNIGDTVFCCLADGYGDNAYSEYVCANENIIAIKPDSVSFEEIASIPMAGVTALQALRNFGEIQEGQKVLINGASGGVGTFAIQIAKAHGAEVTGVCRTESLSTLSSLGADYVIDYTVEDFMESKKKYDLIIDIVANHTFSEYKSILTENGFCVMVGFSSFSHMLNTAVNSLLSKKNKQKIKMLLAQNAVVSDLIHVSELVQEKKIHPTIDKTFLLEDISKAFQYFETEHITGKLIISIDSNNS